MYFLTSTEFFLPSQNSNYGTKSQSLYIVICEYFINLMKKCKNCDILKFVRHCLINLDISNKVTFDTER